EGARQSATRPRLGLVEDLAVLGDLEERDPGARLELEQISRVLAIHLLDTAELTVQLAVELAVEPCRHEEPHARRERADDHREHAGVPQRQARTYTRRAPSHARLSPRANPTPRTVWRSFFSNGSSIFRRSRAIVTSITLSSGVARPLTFHTSRASISRDATYPRWRRRYSRISNSFTVRSTGRPARVTL